MIEKYFRAGVRFAWNKPRDAIGPLDGAIVDSREAATQLVYVGLDGQLIDPFLLQNHVSTIGLSMRMPVPHAWLDYAPGRTARLPVGPYDVLTGYMSGCILARWSAKGVRYVGHIGTINDRPDVNRTVRRTFAFAMAKDTQGFNPLAAWSGSEIAAAATRIRPTPQQPFPPEPKIFGLITTHGQFFAVLMLLQPTNAWCVGGIKAVQPMQHDQLKMMLLRDD